MFTTQLNRKPFLFLPVQNDAEQTMVEVTIDNIPLFRQTLPFSRTGVDDWYCIPLIEGQKVSLSVDCEKAWLSAAYTSTSLRDEYLEESLRPQIHFSPICGGIEHITSLRHTPETGEWGMHFLAAHHAGQPLYEMATVTQDLIHWSLESAYSATGCSACDPQSYVAQDNPVWIGDVCQQLTLETGLTLAVSAPTNIQGMSTWSVCSLPAQETNDGRIVPLPDIAKLRVWERFWNDFPLQEPFRFDMRFAIGPAEWPGVAILPAKGTPDDRRADACEVALELYVGMEPEIIIDLAGTTWVWDALTQSVVCGDYCLPLPAENGRIVMRLFCDRCIRELFTGKQAMVIMSPDGIGKTIHPIHNTEIDNIQNPSFQLEYYAAPYLSISASGPSAHIISLQVYALRPIRPSQHTRRALIQAHPGRLCFSAEHYQVYENCVVDAVYGEPAAWVQENGNVVFSPVRVLEDFQWRPTPWGDMTRVLDTSEQWRICDTHRYPVLKSGISTLNAAYNLAVDTLCKNVSDEYALPGNEGLINAGLLQGMGEGFGFWVRDTCHNAFRAVNLLCPQDIRKSLRLVTRRGFDNGSDAAAMPPIAIWDHYLVTGDRSLLYETFQGVLACVSKADKLFDRDKGLMRAEHSAAQDAFPEPENEGYSLSPQIYYAHMYLCAYRIAEEIGQTNILPSHCSQRGEALLECVRRQYWNADKKCFCSGPRGSKAFSEGQWESTGAELCVWPRFGVADKEQRQQFLSTMESEPRFITDFGVNWYPFSEGKNHFWNTCWVSWSEGLAAAAGRCGNVSLLYKLIFQQVRNVVMNKTFHEAIDSTTGRAWRWPGLTWHASAFLGFVAFGLLGIEYGTEGLLFHPCIPEPLAGMRVESFQYRDALLDIIVQGHGIHFSLYCDNMPMQGPIPTALTGKHTIRLVAAD